MWGYECETCTRDFASQQAAAQHMNALGHWANYQSQQVECDTCSDWFDTQSEADDHMDQYDHWGCRFECETCTRRFKTQNATNQHMNDTDHWAPTFDCESCSRSFNTQNAANSHMNAMGHWIPRFKCNVCDSKFQTRNAAIQHMDKLNHHEHLYCRDCSRGFQNENNLKMVSHPGPVLSFEPNHPVQDCIVLLTAISISTQEFIAAQPWVAHSAKRDSRLLVVCLIIWKPAHAPTPAIWTVKSSTTRSDSATPTVSSPRTF